MGIFSQGPLSPEELQANPVVLYPNPPEPRTPRRNTTVIQATRLCDGEVFEFRGWVEVERLGFDRCAILNSMAPKKGSTPGQYQPAGRPIHGFKWTILEPESRETLPDTYMPTY